MDIQNLDTLGSCWTQKLEILHLHWIVSQFRTRPQLQNEVTPTNGCWRLVWNSKRELLTPSLSPWTLCLFLFVLPDLNPCIICIVLFVYKSLLFSFLLTMIFKFVKVNYGNCMIFSLFGHFASTDPLPLWVGVLQYFRIIIQVYLLATLKIQKLDLQP